MIDRRPAMVETETTVVELRAPTAPPALGRDPGLKGYSPREQLNLWRAPGRLPIDLADASADPPAAAERASDAAKWISAEITRHGVHAT